MIHINCGLERKARVATFLDRAKSYVSGGDNPATPDVGELDKFDEKRFKKEIGRTYANTAWLRKRKLKPYDYRAVNITELTNALDEGSKVLDGHIKDNADAEKRYRGQGKKPLKEFMESVHPLVFSRDLKKALPNEKVDHHLGTVEDIADIGKQTIIIYETLCKILQDTSKFNLGQVDLGNISKIEKDAFYAKADKRSADFFKAAQRYAKEVLDLLDVHLKALEKAT